jgi:hypothetical protein
VVIIMGIVKISSGNSKLGSIQSVSLPSGITCRECGCRSKCYAKRIEQRRQTVKRAYQSNYEVLNTDADTYWREVEASIMMSRYFRFHVSGDIVDDAYLERMVSIAARQQHCEILCFTKKYELINSNLSAGLMLPANLHIIFSAWIGLDLPNPFHLPEAHVRYRNGTTTARHGAYECGGNCSLCAVTDNGCWSLRAGEQVVFNEH